MQFLIHRFFSSIATSVADGAAINPNGIKTLLVIGLSNFPIKDNPVFNIGPKILPKNPPGCPIYVIGFLMILN